MDKGKSLVAPEIEGAVWKKSSYSGSGEGQCVEIAEVRSHGAVAVRDSKRPTGPVLLITPGTFARFLSGAAQGEFGDN
ncbi:DUF397 domain-containing protein [Streptomyces sp. NPDC088789]|uniref:DUF397 domain-containing protein n=1 Tax=Streptomyces sp. NPDC088789 TaxID=3365899 RepID=UPI0037F18AC4